MKKEDVAILTWHYYSNYGSALQAYALQESINDLGYKTKILNYRNPKFGKISKIKDGLKYLLAKIFSYNSIFFRKFSYPFLQFQKDFLKQTNLIQDESQLPNLCRKFNIVICGSDQIWAPNVFNPTYFLDFVPDNKKKISYAASIGLNDVPVSLIPHYSHLLSSFNKISVREAAGVEILKEKCGLDAQVVLDPTLLVEVSKWRSIEKKPSNNIRDEFIFCYFLNNNHNYKDSVLNFARKNSYKMIGCSSNAADSGWMDKKLDNIGPQEFLWLVNNAKVVLTDSYHGTTFSLLYHKDFITFERFSNDDKINQNARVYQLRSYFSLENQITKVTSETTLSVEKLNYYNFEKELSKLRKVSLDYLNSALEE